jgi:uncharacterized protein YndB with AHSA1/START domain
MVAIVKERMIAVAPQRVYDALTQQDEIARWWTRDVSAKPEVGSLAEFRFRQGAAVQQWEIAELHAAERVQWMLRQGPPQWAGTSVTWQLTPDQNGTRLLFTHDGLAQVDEAYEQASGNWDYFLDSLKSYLETGSGWPGDPRYF